MADVGSCPFCGEWASTQTIECPYCGQSLEPPTRESVFDDQQVDAGLAGQVDAFTLAYVRGAELAGACLGGIGVILLFFLLAIYAMRHKVEGQPVSLKVETEGQALGNKRPVKMTFKFRNSRYCEEFATLNTVQEEQNLGW